MRPGPRVRLDNTAIFIFSDIVSGSTKSCGRLRYLYDAVERGQFCGYGELPVATRLLYNRVDLHMLIWSGHYRLRHPPALQPTRHMTSRMPEHRCQRSVSHAPTGL